MEGIMWSSAAEIRRPVDSDSDVYLTCQADFCLRAADLVPALQAPRLGTRDSARAPAPRSKAQALPGSKTHSKVKNSKWSRQCQESDEPRLLGRLPCLVFGFGLVLVLAS